MFFSVCLHHAVKYSISHAVWYVNYGPNVNCNHVFGTRPTWYCKPPAQNGGGGSPRLQSDSKERRIFGTSIILHVHTVVSPVLQQHVPKTCLKRYAAWRRTFVQENFFRRSLSLSLSFVSLSLSLSLLSLSRARCFLGAVVHFPDGVQ